MRLIRRLCLALSVSVLGSSTAWALGADEEANVALVQRYFRLMFEVRDSDAAAALLAEDYVSHHQPEEPKAQMLARFKRMQDSAPDVNAPHRPPLRVMAQGDLVFMLFAVPPRPDKPRDTPKLAFELYRIKNDRLVEHWDAFSDAVPMPAGH